jgi:hypothetical protein
MRAKSHDLIQIDGLKKVFLTDEVETHALSGVKLDIKPENLSRSPGLQAAENPPCSL